MLRAGIPPLKGRKIRYYKDKWMVKASSMVAPSVTPRPLDPSIARRSLAIIEGIEAPEMSDQDALAGVEFARLVGFPFDELPDDGDPHKATAFFAALGLNADFTGINFDDLAGAAASADPASENGPASGNQRDRDVEGPEDADGPENGSTADDGAHDEGGDSDALAFLKGAKG